MYPGNSTDSLNNPLTAFNTIHLDTLNTSYADLPLMDYAASASELISAHSPFSVYPNPAGTTLNLNIHSSANPVKELLILNQTGQVIMRMNALEADSKLDISALNSGLYLIRISTDEGVFSQRFIKL